MKRTANTWFTLDGAASSILTYTAILFNLPSICKKYLSNRRKTNKYIRRKGDKENVEKRVED